MTALAQRFKYQTNRNKPPTKIPNEALLKDVEQHPDDYLYERARRFNCSKSGMHNALKRLGISQKKTLEHPKACLIKRASYQSKLDSFTQQGYPIVYMDESGFEAETIRPYGYSPIGKPCIDSFNWQAKSALMSSVLCIKRCCLRLITLNKISTAIYFMTGANIRLFQVSRLNA
nr:IS630 transposase-related protein [Psychrobacter sp. CMS30]